MNVTARFVGTVLLVGCCACHAQFVKQRQLDYPLDGVVLGNGWSTLAASKTPGACVDFREVQDQSEDRTLDLSRVVDKEQLNRELAVSVEFQAKAIGGVGASAKASYAKSLEVKNESLNLTITARVTQGARYVAPKERLSGIQLTSAARRLAANNLPQFLALCGDSFIAAIHGGGEMNALLTFDVSSTDEREAVSASMSAGGLSYSGSASMNQTMRQYRENQKLRILMHSAGGTGVAIPVNEQELLERLRSLPADAKTAPKPYRMSVARYDALPNWPKGSLPAVNFSDMEQLVAQYQRYASLYFDTFTVLEHPEKYVFRGNLSLNSLKQLQDRIRLSLLPPLADRIAACLATGNCSVPAVAANLDYELRMSMPVSKGSFSEDIQLTQLIANREATAAAHAAEPNSLFIELPVDRQILKIPVPNQRKTDLSTRLAALDASLITARTAYPEALASAIQKQWIETPSFHRCVENPVWDYCLSQGQLSVYKARIATLVQ